MLDQNTDLSALLKDQSLLATKAYLGGEWADADDGKTFDVTNPARGDVIASVADLSRAETARAIAADTYSATIPGYAVGLEGVQYYLTAIDSSAGAQASAVPAGAPARGAYSGALAHSQIPRMSLSPVAQGLGSPKRCDTAQSIIRFQVSFVTVWP